MLLLNQRFNIYIYMYVHTMKFMIKIVKIILIYFIIFYTTKFKIILKYLNFCKHLHRNVYILNLLIFISDSYSVY